MKIYVRVILGIELGHTTSKLRAQNFSFVATFQEYSTQQFEFLPVIKVKYLRSRSLKRMVFKSFLIMYPLPRRGAYCFSAKVHNVDSNKRQIRL